MRYDYVVEDGYVIAFTVHYQTWANKSEWHNPTWRYPVSLAQEFYYGSLQ